MPGKAAACVSASNLELLTPEDRPNYAAYLLADENGSSLQVAKYAGIDRVDLIENRDYGRCSLIKALKALLDRVNVENTIFTKIGYPLRQEREMINSIAIREAIINAVVHNDYSYGATPKLEFFSDRAEVTSMGGLPYGVTEKDFFGGCSVPRNKEIMCVFRDLEVVEHLGSGVPRILKAYGKEAFEIRESYVRIVFRYAKPIAEVTGQVTEQVGEQVSEQVIRLLNCLRDTSLGTREVMKVMDVRHRPTFLYDYLQPAMDDGLLEMTQPASPKSPTQKYRLTAKGRALVAVRESHLTRT